MSATTSAVRLMGSAKNAFIASTVCSLNVAFVRIIWTQVSLTSSTIYWLASVGFSWADLIALVSTRYGMMKNWLEVYPSGSRVHMNPKRG